MTAAALMGLTFRRRVELSFAAILALALATGLASWLQHRALAGSAGAVNLSGSQRMRSWRMATLASRIASGSSAADPGALEDELRRFATVLAGLRDGDAILGLRPAPDADVAAALERAGAAFAALEPRVRRIIDARAAAGPADVDAVVAAAADVAARMDDATFFFEAAAGRTLRLHGRVQLALFGATVAIALVAFQRLRRYVLLALPRLETALDGLGHGGLGAEVHLEPGADEVVRIERAFNRMSHDLERARETILKHEAELVRADRMKTEFLATMSHELRTPLTAVIGFAELLRGGVYGPIEPRQGERLEAILRNARSLLALIGDLLDVAKIEAGRVEVSLVPASVGEIADEVVATLRPLAQAKNLALELSIEEGLPSIATDAGRVRQVLLNLGSNAIKFTSCGTVRIRAVRAGENELRIEVEDTGAGIPPEALPRLFRRFEQLDPSATRRHGGTGLGLYISRRLAELLGGRIEVASTLGTGSQFALVLPVNTGGESHVERDSKAEAQADPRR